MKKENKLKREPFRKIAIWHVNLSASACSFLYYGMNMHFRRKFDLPSIWGENGEFQSLVSQTFKWKEQSSSFSFFFPPWKGKKTQNHSKTTNSRDSKRCDLLIFLDKAQCLTICSVFAWPCVRVDVNWAALNPGEGNNSQALSTAHVPCAVNLLNSVWSNMAVKPRICTVRWLDCSYKTVRVLELM